MRRSFAYQNTYRSQQGARIAVLGCIGWRCGQVKNIAAVILVFLASAAAWPQSAPFDHKFYNDSGPAVIPFDLFKNQIFVPMQVNGSRPLWFILDTGANTAALDETIAHELG